MDERSPAPQSQTTLGATSPARRRGGMWIACGLSMMVGAGVVVWVGLRPVMRELDAVQTRLTLIDGAMHRLVRDEGAANQAASLLGALADQARHYKNASGALAEIDALHDRLIDKADRWSASLESLIVLQEKVVASTDQAAEAANAIDEIARVQKELVAEGDRSGAATQAIASLADVRQYAATLHEDSCDVDLALDELADLQARILAQRNAAGPIGQVLAELSRLATLAVDAAADTSAARDSVIALAEVKSLALVHEGSADLARDRLAGLVALQDQVVSQTDDLADAIETLELSTDLRDQLGEVVQSLGRLRQWMTEIVMMEPAIVRTLGVLKPLTDLGNLRRMAPDELRRAARVVADGREERTAALKNDPAQAPAPE